MTTETAPPGLAAATAAEPGEFTRGKRAWIAVMLAVVAFLAATDRNILSVLLVPIQNDLKVSDAAMGALTGAAFSFVYASAALPLAWLADRTNRRNFIALSVAFWSAMTALCGLAGSYVQLLLARFGVALGEAGHGPAGMSMVADVYPAAKRGAAISVLTIGAALGYSAGAFVAGVLNDQFGWQGALMAVGLPGLLIAVVLFLTVPEPKRGAQDGARAAVTPVSVLAGLKTLSQVRTFWPLMGGMIFLNIAFMGWLHWLPAFLMRIHHLTTTEMSAIFGMIVGVGGVVANIFAGVISDKLAQRGSRWRMYYCVAMGAVSVPLLVVGLMLKDATFAIACMMTYTLAAGGLTTVTNAAAISIAPANLRASMVALIGFAVAVFGGGVAPFLIGLLNDTLKASLGVEAIRYTLLVGPIGIGIAALMFLLASRTIDGDADRGEPAAAPAH
jgi:predicted MFS family arabinose efflux permease